MDTIEVLFKNCVALTGSIATGKSLVARILQDLGAHLIDTDRIAREVVEPGSEALSEIVARFGSDALNENGTLNREWMRSAIIRDPSLRECLNRITHPRIQSVVVRRVEEYQRRGDGMPIVIDVPLLYEAGWDRFFPTTIVVYAPREIQIQRLMARDGIDRRTAEQTVAAQMDVEEKKKKARYVIDNSGTIDETRKQVEKLFTVLCA